MAEKSIADKIAEARASGYTDLEISQFLLATPQVKEAIAGGYSSAEIFDHLGLKTQSEPGIGRTLDLAGQGIIQGMADTVGLPGTLRDMAIHMLSGGDPRQEAVNRAQLGVLGALPTMDQTTSVTDSLDLTNQTYLQPQDQGERLLAGAAKGFGGSLGLGGPVGMLAGTAGGLAATETNELFPGSQWLGPMVGLATGLGVGGMAGKIKGMLNASQIKNSAASARAALDTFLNANTDTTLAKASIAAKDSFDAQAAAAQAIHQTKLGMVDSQIEGLASASGASKTLQEAGQTLQSEAESWVKKSLPSKLEKIWQPVDAAIPKDAPVNLAAFGGALREVTDDAGELSNVVRLLRPTLPEKLAKQLEETIGNKQPAASGAKALQEIDPALRSTFVRQDSAEGLGKEDAGYMRDDFRAVRYKGEIFTGRTHIDALDKLFAKYPEAENNISVVESGYMKGASNTGQSFNWSDVRKLRTALGEALSTPSVMKDIGEKNLSKLYGALTGDLKTTAKALGAEPLFDAANGASTKLYDFGEQVVSPLIKEGVTPEQAAKTVLTKARAGGTVLADLRSQLPSAVDELAAAGVRTGEWSKLSPEAKAALVPDSSRLAALELGHSAKEGLVTQFKDSTTAAKKVFADSRALSKAAKTEMGKALAKRVKETSAAEAALPTSVPLKDQAEHLIQRGALGATVAAGAGLLSGAELGHLAPHALLGSLAAWAIPNALGVGEAVVRQSSLLLAPTAGALGGNAAGNP